MQLVVVIAVRNAVSAATITFTATSITRAFFHFYPFTFILRRRTFMPAEVQLIFNQLGEP